MKNIRYQIERNTNPAEFRDLLIRSTLGERRPIHDPARVQKMLENANLIITARIEDKLIGIARSLTDQTYITYLSDLAVDQDYQKQGIGKELIRQTKLAVPQAKVILISAPKSIRFYPKIGMHRHDHCYFLDDLADLK